MSGTNPLYDAVQGATGKGPRRVESTDKFPAPTAARLVALIARVGIRGADVELYVARTFRHYLGKGHAPLSPSSIRAKRAPDGTALDDWVRARCWTVLEEHAAELPALEYKRHPDKSQRS